MSNKNERLDVYQKITNQIIQAIEHGAGKWDMPWHQSQNIPRNALSQKAYRGVNVLALWAAAAEKEYRAGLWATYAQWGELGAQVRKGEQATCIVFWKFQDSTADKEDEHEIDGQTTRRRPIARAYSVFNVHQVDGFSAPELPQLPACQRIKTADDFVSRLAPDVRYGGNRAFYSDAGDYIQMPQFSIFKEAKAFYSTLSHELIHWTGAKERLDRDMKNRFGSEAYAAEELIAELGAAFLCADLQLCNEPRPDHAAYIQTWLGILRNDPRAIFTAASKAQEAVDWMTSKTTSEIVAA